MNWKAAITGDMTLSILDQKGFKILGVDMLRTRTMRAGTNGDCLVLALNDLALLAAAASSETLSATDLPDPLCGVSPLPWSLEEGLAARRLQVRDRNGRVIGERVFPKAMRDDDGARIAAALQNAVARVNSSCRSMSCTPHGDSLVGKGSDT